MRKRKEGTELYKSYIKTSAIGLEVGLSIVVGAAGGYLADKYLGTRPWGLIFGFIVGVLAAAKRLFGFAKKYVKENEEDERSQKRDD